MPGPNTQILTTNKSPMTLSGDTLVVTIKKGDSLKGDLLNKLSTLSNGGLAVLKSNGSLTGNLGELVWLPVQNSNYKRVALVGAGDCKQSDYTEVQAREFFGNLSRKLRSVNAGEIVMTIDPIISALKSVPLGSQAAAEGLILGQYRFDTHHTKKADKPKFTLGDITIAVGTKTSAVQLANGVSKGSIIAEAINTSRDLANTPANLMTPTIVAERAREIADQTGIKIEIIERADAERLGMGSYLSVANGSHQPPKFIVMTYKNGGPTKPIALVGKGITFDTGGTSLKPAGGMESMKYDMSGAATVISAIGAIARLKLKTHVVAIAPCTENMPGGGATKPGDVVYAMDGQSIEVINTDAEGRLVLADGIAYAKKVKNAGVILDVATLTGAMSVSLGDYRIGVFCNQDSLFRQLNSVAQSTGELVWRMPLDDYYSKQIKSEVADLANTGGRLAGSITAAKFIEAFVGDSPWAHFDIAGLMAAKSDSGIHIKGSSGVPTKSLIEYVSAKSPN